MIRQVRGKPSGNLDESSRQLKYILTAKAIILLYGMYTVGEGIKLMSLRES
jgi:hypothetical protein